MDSSEQSLHEAAEVERDCERLAECAQWTYRVSRFLFEGPCSTTRAERFAGLFRLTARGAASRAWMGVVHGLYAQRLDEHDFERLYEGATSLDEELIRLILVADDTPHAQARPSEFASDPVLDAVTLGERKSLARRMDVELLERLAKDSEPSVVRILLGNPKLCESLVLRMISLRPHRAEVLKEFARQPRWLNRAPVRRALVLNPYTPVRLAMLLCPLLDEATAREVNDALNLHPGLRRLARGLLALRPHPRIFRVDPEDTQLETMTLETYLLDS